MCYVVELDHDVDGHFFVCKWMNGWNLNVVTITTFIIFFFVINMYRYIFFFLD